MKRFLAVLLTALLVIPAVLVFSASADEVLVSKGKSYTVSGSGKGYDKYTTDLTDGNTLDVSSYEAGKWFGLYYNKTADASVINAPDGIGTITIDLGEVTESIATYKAHVLTPAKDGIGVPEYINVAVSADNAAFTEIGSLSGLEKKDNAYWVSLTTEKGVSARYVRFSVKIAGGVFAFLDELEVYTDASKEAGEPTPTPTPTEDTVINLLDGVDITTIDVDGENGGTITCVQNTDGSIVAEGTNSWPHADVTFKEKLSVDVTKAYLEVEAEIGGGKGNGSIRILGEDPNSTDAIFLHHYVDAALDSSGDAPAGTVVNFKKAFSELSYCDYTAEANWIGKIPFGKDSINITALQLWCSGGSKITVKKLNIIIPGTGTPTPVKETITVDGNVDDNGWKADGWKEANLNNSTWQTDPAEGITADISYKYQFRADDDKFYVAVIFDGESIDVAEGIEDGNGKGTFVRAWMQSKTAEGYADAVSYTHFYDIYRQGEGTVLHAWKNTFTNEKGNKKEAIANTTGSAASSVKDGKTYYEFSIGLDEFTKGDFQMFLNIGSLFGEGDSTTYLITLHPAVDAPIKDDGKKDLTNFPYNIWNTEKALDVKLADIKLDNGDPQPPVDDDPDKKYIEEIIASVGEKNPDGQFDLVIEAPEEYKAGDEITVNVKIKNIKVEEGIVSLLADFYYDNEKLTLLNTADEDGAIECITLPDSWENLVKQDKDEQHNVIDNGHITLAVLTGKKKPVKDDDSLTFTFKFKVKEDAKNAIGFYIPHESVTAKKYDLTDVLGNGGYAITKMHVEGGTSSSSSTAQTGDGSTSMIVFAIVALVAICGSAVVIKSRK